MRSACSAPPPGRTSLSAGTVPGLPGKREIAQELLGMGLQCRAAKCVESLQGGPVSGLGRDG